MHRIKILIHLILLITTPTLFALPQDKLDPRILSYFSSGKEKLDKNLKKKKYYPQVTYDQILSLLEDIETGKIEKKYRPKDLDRIDRFLAHLAKKGILYHQQLPVLQIDIEYLLRDCYEILSLSNEEDFEIIPAIATNDPNITLCTNWFSKKWKKTRHFAKKHKKEILIGAVIVVATAAIIITVAATNSPTAAAGAAGAASAAAGVKELTKPIEEFESDNPALQNEIEHQVVTLKETIKQEHLFNPADEFTWEETGRILGTLFATENLHIQNPELTSEEIQKSFSTNYIPPIEETNLTTNFYQLRGEKALEYGCPTQAITDFGKAIALNPQNSLSYLNRSIAYFDLGDYEQSLKDFHQFTTQKKPFSLPSFTYGFVKGLPQGICESGGNIFLFLTGFMTNPVHTCGQMWEALNILSNLVFTAEWKELAQTLAPEIRQLIIDWNTLTSEEKGERSGYAFGKYGTDLLAPGAIAKIAAKGVKGAQELARAYKNIENAKKTLLLETVTQIGEKGKIGEVIASSERTLNLAEELGFTPGEMGQLKKVGELEETIIKTYEEIAKDPAMLASIRLFNDAETYLKGYKGYRSEQEIRKLIHTTGIKTFPRPPGIPENYRIKLSKGGAGMKYVHPQNEQTYVRVMPGKSHSKYPHQRKPYVIQMVDGKTLDKHGNIVPKDVPEAHIPLKEYVYLGGKI